MIASDYTGMTSWLATLRHKNDMGSKVSPIRALSVRCTRVQTARPQIQKPRKCVAFVGASWVQSGFGSRFRIAQVHHLTLRLTVLPGMGHAMELASRLNTEVVTVNGATYPATAQDLDYVSITGAFKFAVDDHTFGTDFTTDQTGFTDHQTFFHFDGPVDRTVYLDIAF